MGKGNGAAMRRGRKFSTPIESLETRLLFAQPTGALTGKIVYTVGGHGITADYPGTGAWATQRGDNNDLVEDFGNQDQMTFYVNYLFNAGATVVPMRPVGNQPNEVVLNNTQATYTGTWSNGAQGPYFGGASDAVKYKQATASTTQTAVAKFTPNIPKGGIYPVYAWALDGADRLPDQTYRVNYTGGSSEVKVNHQRVGKGWVYLGSYYFAKGTGGSVEVSNKSSSSGIAIADAIRFGNGMGDVNRGAGVSGYAREDEPALYWIMRGAGVGTPQSAYYGTNTNDRDATVSAAPRYAAYMNNEAFGTNTDRIFLSFHTNAGSGSNRGTLGLLNGNNDPATATPHMVEWATLVAREVNDDMVKLGNAGKLEHTWFDRGSVVTLDRTDIEFGEINNLRINNEFDATIIEVGFHDNVQDAQVMLDPKARDWMARASYQATAKYFNQFAGTNATALPESPTNVRAVAGTDGSITINWATPAVDNIGGAAATGYRVYTSTNGLGFDGGRAVSGGLTTSLKITGLSSGQVYYFKVAGTNAGGESKGSEVVASRPRTGGTKQVLIVNAFDRLDRSEDFSQSGKLNSASAVVDTWFRARGRFNNTKDYVSLVGEAIEAYGTIAVDTVGNEAVSGGQVNLGDYKYVIWLDGEEGVKGETLSSTERSKISTYLANNGKLFMSGSEIGFDLVGNNKAASFFTGSLRSGYVADDAGTYTASGAGGSIFEAIDITFDNGTGGTYDVDAPDKLSATNGSKVALNYTGTGSGAAATQYSNATGQRVVNMGFPFESITNGGVRNAVMKAVLNFFGAGPAAPSGLTIAGGSNIKLDWNNNPETNIKGYNVYRARSRNGPYEKIASLVTTSAYTDATVLAGKTYYYRVTGVTTSNFEGLFSAIVSGRKSTLMIDAGGSGYTDTKGNVWVSDRGFTGGTTATSNFAVGNTVEDALYQSRRFGDFGYSIDVPNGDYQLKLYFADPSFTTSGKRKFDVLVEGATVLNDYDLAANGGGRAAVTKTFNVSITDGKLSLFFDGVVDNAIVSAIELV